MGKVIILSAPSGAGKTTLAKFLLRQTDLKLKFSVSATTRLPRNNETNGVDYYFLPIEEFKQQQAKQAFIETEEVYKGLYYGTLKSEVERIFAQGYNVLFDVDVKGGLNLKRYFGSQALSVFVAPPSIAVLEQRLRNRHTETEEKIKQRLQRVKEEMTYQSQFDTIIINDSLETTQEKLLLLTSHFLLNETEWIKK